MKKFGVVCTKPYWFFGSWDWNYWWNLVLQATDIFLLYRIFLPLIYSSKLSYLIPLYDSERLANTTMLDMVLSWESWAVHFGSGHRLSRKKWAVNFDFRDLVIPVFTDRSGTESAIFTDNLDISVSLRLSKTCTIVQAKIYAINRKFMQ